MTRIVVALVALLAAANSVQALSSVPNAESAAAAQARLAQLRTQFEQSQSPIINILPEPVTPVPAVEIPAQNGFATATTASITSIDADSMTPPPSQAMTVKTGAVTSTPPAVSSGPQLVTGYKKPKTFSFGPGSWELYPQPLSEAWDKHYS